MTIQEFCERTNISIKNAKGFDDSQSKPVVMRKNDGSFIKVFGSIHEAAKETGYTMGLYCWTYKT